MKLSMQMPYAGGFEQSVQQTVALEKAGLDIVYVAEAYSFDAVSAMGYIAAKTSTVEIASGILPIYTRTPTLLAMTAAGLDHVSDGRCIMGLGASGPQVIEGFHGVKYDAPLGRTREIIEICRKVWAREEKLTYDGKYYQLPLPPEQGTGLGKPLKPITHPRRADIPIMLGAEGPKNVALTAEIADGWLPIFYSPRIAPMYNEWLDEGFARPGARRSRADFEICATAQVVVTDDRPAIMELMKPHLALYMGGMGSEDTNFHAEVYRRMGYGDVVDEVTALFRSGRKDEAAAIIPDAVVDDAAIVGDTDYVRSKVREWEAAGVTTMLVSAGSVEQIEQVAEVVGNA